VDVDNLLVRKTWRCLATECHMKRSSAVFFVNVVAVRKFPCIGDHRLETGVHPANSTDAAIDRDEVFSMIA
jgi:hypothetical protein